MHDRVFHLEPSRKLGRFYIVLFILAALCVLIAPIYLFLKLLLMIILIGAAAHLFGNILPLCQPMAILSMEKQTKGWWQVTCPSGSFIAKLSPETYASQFFIIVHFETMEGRKFSTFIYRDMLSKRAYRHLLCRLIEPQVEASYPHQSPQT